MLKVGLLCGVIAAMSATGAKVNVNNKTFESKPLDAQFILELEDDINDISTDKAIKQQNAVYQKVRNSINANATQDKNFTLLTNAVVVSANKEDIDELRKIPGVKYVTENGTHIVEKTQGNFISLDLNREGEADEDSENASAVTMKKPEVSNEGEGTFIAVLDNEFYLRGRHVDENNQPQDAYCHETFTELPSGTKERISFGNVSNSKAFKETHARQYANDTSEGGLGGYVNTRGNEGSFYFNNKVPFYFDYAGDSYSGGSYGAKPDFNVESKIDLHGSHVASIAAGNADTYKGIAPKAQLACMKVFTDIHKTPASDAAKMGQYGRFSEVAFIEALEDCIKIGVDAINVSIGSDLSDFEEGTISQRMLQRITDAGILSAISAGNAGKMSYAFTGGYANWTKDLVETGIMGSFANNRSSMTVASGQPSKTFYSDAVEINGQTVPYDDQIVNRDGQPADYDNEHRFVELINGGISDPDAEGFEPDKEVQDAIEIPYVYLKGFGEDKDYKNVKVTDKIVVVNRGKINFSAKYTNADSHGAKGLIIVNNDPTTVDFTFRCDFGDVAKSIQFPIAVALFKDKPIFEENPQGTFKIRRNRLTENPLAKTISDFSTDGSTYDLDLKPEITTPGTNIKGAVWPQNKVEKKTPYSAYEYFNGTSMAAPNYEGAMALVLSKVAKSGSLDAIAAERTKIDMKMMSTADPMFDSEKNQENDEFSLTSPRMQGAGMVDLEGAYNTDVYLEGKDYKNSSDGEFTNKAKIVLRNNEDIANGRVKLSFVAHNDSNYARSYKVSYNVMRPAVAYSNKVLTKDYGAPIEVSSVKEIPGWEYFSPEEEKVIHADGEASYKDVIKVSKDIEYYTSAEEYAQETPLGRVKEGMYYCATEKQGDPIVWKEIPNIEYQSIKDVEIAKVDCGVKEVAAHGDTNIDLTEYELSAEQKDKIQELYQDGTYLEGFISLEAMGDYPDLSMPYMGFYSLSDRISEHDYSNAPVVEPFSFEKDPTKIYGSDLVNDVAKSLLGKDSADMGSMMLTGYAKNINEINTDKILSNDNNFTSLKGFYPVGTKPDPYASDLTDDPKENIYAGNPQKSNTLIIQQFVYRSVKDNFFTITNKETGKEVYRSALEDCLYGDTAGKYALYKSHVDGGLLGGGYTAHRAWAIVPLYDLMTKEAFDSGEYELKFNYQLAATDKWVSKAYNLHLDSQTPVIKTIDQFKKDGEDFVRITYKDTKCAYAIVGSTKVDVMYDEATGLYYSEVEKDIFDGAQSSSQATSFSKSRVLIRVVDYARGETTAICHFDGNYSNYVIAQGSEFTLNHDFKFENGQVSFIEVNGSKESEFTPKYGVKISTGARELPVEEEESSAEKQGFFARIAEFFRSLGEKLASLFKKN